MMSERVYLKDLTHDVDKAFIPSPASPYSSITTTTLSFASSSCPYSSSSSSSFSSVSPSSTLSPQPEFLTSCSTTTSTLSTIPSTLSLPDHRLSAPSPSPSSSSSSSLSTSSNSSTIPLTPPPTPPTPSPSSCQMTFQEAVQNGNSSELQRLLEEREGKININLFDQEGQTALHQVCLKGNLELVKLLVRYGADVGLANRDGWNPLHIAAFGGHKDILLYLSTVPRKRKSSPFSPLS